MTKREFTEALEHVEAAAKVWQSKHPKAMAFTFLGAAGSFITNSMAPLSEETFEAFLGEMRQQYTRKRADLPAARRIE